MRFRLSRWRIASETREQLYVETSARTRRFSAKEVMLFGLGPRFLSRYKAIFDKLYAGDRRIAINRGIWGLVLGTVGQAAFYGMYLWIALSRTIDGLLNTPFRRDDDVRRRVQQGNDPALSSALA